MTSTTDVNAQFDTDRAGQIQMLQDARADYQNRVADFESGAAQAALDAKLAGQVADGKIAMIGDGRYRVLEGWDRNEVFSVQRATRPGELTLILPESGLDQGTGYFDRPEWHGEGFVELGGSSDIERVLAKSGLDYDVMQKPVRYHDSTGLLRTDPRAFENYRSDNGDPLGVVGTRYRPFQNRDAFAFLQEMVSDHGVNFASAAPLDGGRRCFISLELPEHITLDIPGLPGGDKIVPYVAVFNSHDGSGLFKAVVTPWRPRCKNTERLAVKGAYTSWGVRHTASASARAAEAARQLGLAGQYYERFREDEEALARLDIEMDEFDALIADLYPVPGEVAEGQRKLTARETNFRERRETKLRGIFAQEAGQVGRTAYAAERAVTNYLDFGVNRSQGSAPSLAAARASAILEGADDDIKSRAHAKLMLRNR
jgi:phage/plasmid-like protein (TIGR03299 family)